MGNLRLPPNWRPNNNHFYEPNPVTKINIYFKGKFGGLLVYVCVCVSV